MSWKGGLRIIFCRKGGSGLNYSYACMVSLLTKHKYFKCSWLCLEMPSVARKSLP